ncbi:MAG: Na+/H+ antiporter subunit E [Hyphomicrobium sp.]|uniref:Na+/H+ antiporter subunit E n=1 Tax=Hyphomicrobium sp. TaxID=82 RepID=UPI0039E5A051
MSTPVERSPNQSTRSATLRISLFFVFWLMISGWAPADFPVGLVTAAAAAWISLYLLPAGGSRLHARQFAALIQNFARQSIISGVDVARQALRPQLQLHPGFIAYHCHLQPGITRSAFCALSSLLPGTLPTGTDGNDTLLVHCLDVEQPVAANLATEEALFTGVLIHV